MPILTVITPETTHTLEVEHGANLRRVLLDAGYSPYTDITKRLNCGGNGICATCGVWIETNVPPAVHWHDKLADDFGYPRLSCQITLIEDMTIRMVDKWLWGDRDATRARYFKRTPKSEAS
jgi:ferredoxin